MNISPINYNSNPSFKMRVKTIRIPSNIRVQLENRLRNMHPLDGLMEISATQEPPRRNLGQELGGIRNRNIIRNGMTCCINIRSGNTIYPGHYCEVTFDKLWAIIMKHSDLLFPPH